MKSLLRIENLVVNLKTEIGEVKAVRDISFDLKVGETLAIVGESGCGKTILCKSLIRILPRNGYIKSGRVMFNGEDLLSISTKKMEYVRGKDISMIFQDPMTALNPTMSIGKQILEAVLVNEKISKTEGKKKVIDLINMVGIDNANLRYNQYPHQLSGGMRQRVVIAIALACKPKILIADEPTTALDVTIQAQILALLKEIQEKLGVSIMIITHDFGVVASIADRVAVMYAGKIVEIGKVEEIFNEPYHPYTIGLLKSLHNFEESSKYLYSLPGIPVNLLDPPIGDAFARRNSEALKIDFLEEPPMFKISETHSVATWTLHPLAKESRVAKLDREVSNG